MNLRNPHSGQILPLSIACLLLLALLAYQLVVLGTDAVQKQRLADAADAAAYSGLVWEARRRNLAARIGQVRVARDITEVQSRALLAFGRSASVFPDGASDIQIEDTNAVLLSGAQGPLQTRLEIGQISAIVEHIVQSKDPRFVVRDIRREHPEGDEPIGTTGAAAIPAGVPASGHSEHSVEQLRVMVALPVNTEDAEPRNRPTGRLHVPASATSAQPVSVGLAELIYAKPSDTIAHDLDIFGEYGPWWMVRLAEVDRDAIPVPGAELR